ncbi:diaminopimelate epimerase [Derxia gummosa]|uniref:Diaminopimelate epimerase n=1 Tax=Derxia gummosa DSM 723 TaxID=1121388 RepID=A0A8B6X5S2_9BURK|nr:diaminopimelate epimerase [Derxia gummosa]
MKLRFTKMHGAGNDFIVIDATREPVELPPERWQALADRHYGIGADQILIVGKPNDPANDFSYRIVNSDGSEVEHCGNGARAFMHFVTAKGLTTKRRVSVEIMPGLITLEMDAAGAVTAGMGVPVLDAARVPFDAAGLVSRREGELDRWPLDLGAGRTAEIGVVSMGNPHAVLRVDDVDTAPVTTDGPVVENHPRFPRRTNVGFVQVVDEHHIRLRVWERGAGETLACGTGACGAVVAAILAGWVKSPVRIAARGGELSVAWAGPGSVAYLGGPTAIVFEGEVEI